MPLFYKESSRTSKSPMIALVKLACLPARPSHLVHHLLWRSLKREGRKPHMRYVLAGALTSDGILKILQHRAKQAGITTHMTPHVLRAIFITLALDNGAPLHKVQYAAGRADPRTTERYHRSKLNLDDNAVDYLKL